MCYFILILVGCFILNGSDTLCSVNNMHPLIDEIEWLREINEESRTAMRKHVFKMGYKNILDAACGPAFDYWGFKYEKTYCEDKQIEYHGLSASSDVVNFVRKQNINIAQGDIENLPFANSQFDVTYIRDGLDKLNGYHRTINELIRVAKKEVIISYIFSQINSAVLQECVRTNPKVSNLTCENINKDRIIMHIYLK